MQGPVRRILKMPLFFLAFLAALSLSPAGAAPSEKRLALVIGNASYKTGTLARPANDAALIAQTLQAAGFDVIGARDLDGDGLGRTFRDFIDRVRSAGPNAVAAVYFAGYGLQLEGENYLVPIDADISKASDVPLRAVRLSEQMLALAMLHLKASFMILDVARASPFLLSGQPPAGGLAWIEPETNMLIAFSVAPGTVSPDAGDGYGPYAKALAETIREGGLTPAQVFDRVRLRVNELTKGAQVPWDVSSIEAQFMFFERGPGAPPRADSPERTAWMRSQPMRKLGPNDAYMVALIRDTFDAYTDFLADYSRDPMTKRVRALLTVRREAITWRRTYQANTPDAYWSYLERYPRGSHVADARRLLTRLGATTALPLKFARMDYDIPPPLPDEAEYVERTVLMFDDPAFAFEPPPPSPVHFLEPQPSEIVALAPPAAPSGAHTLPTPMFVSLPDYVDVPAYVVIPPNSFIFNNAHKAPAVNATTNAPNKPDGKAISSSASAPGTAGKNNLAEISHLPPSVATTNMLNDGPNPPPLPASPAAREVIKVPQSPAVSAASTPLWADLNPAARQEINEPPSSPLPPIPLLPLWATDYKTSAKPGMVPTMLAPQPTGVPLRSRSAATQSPIPPAQTFPAPTASNRPTPIAHPPPKAADRSGQPLASSVDGLAPSVQRRPQIAPGAASPKPLAKKPCPIVNGQPGCS
ncbi:caspase family protein [Bradyrhizobium erythrophlei]|uniref:Uncharacterized protein, contains caspase domain n=1 Tax=Bradyrhizobium erythrophlei TaxID=1437360 RepID=A0A1M5PD52_9BRAD|nr:caspase domain-containing protein [Bradyrhizobium erythrophlei]SHG99658.1 Uncharacterized protein, contains caspase domain [Bradyrhizobium erythrophlei]